MLVVVRGRDLPGRTCGDHRDVHVGLQVGAAPAGLVPSDAPEATWETEVRVVPTDAGVDLRGPAVHGRRGERFLYLTWGKLAADGAFAMFRRAKLMLDALGPGAGDAATATGVLGLTDACGMPRCARVVPPDITWTLA